MQHESCTVISCPEAKNFDASKADPYLGIVSPGLFDVEDTGRMDSETLETGKQWKANTKQHCSGIQTKYLKQVERMQRSAK